MLVAFGSDHRGFRLKEKLKRTVERLGHTTNDLGPPNAGRSDYPDYAFAVAREVAAGRAERGILICSTGIGMSIAANRIPGVRAALCDSVRLARRSRLHNDANVLCLGADVVTATEAGRILRVWLSAEFAGGRHARRLAKIECGIPEQTRGPQRGRRL